MKTLRIPAWSFAQKVCIALILGAIFALCGTAKATDYYIDPATGSMTNPGTSDSPWSTLEAVFTANKSFAAGDTIYLRSGYHGAPAVKGTNSGVVTIQPDTGATPKVRTLVVRNASQWVISGLDICPGNLLSGTYPASGATNTTDASLPSSTSPASPYYLGNIVDIQSTSNYITLQNCSVKGATNIVGWTATDLQTKLGSGVAINVAAPNTTVSNNTLQNVAVGISVAKTAPFTTVSGNSITNFCQPAMRGLADDCAFEYNTVLNSYAQYSMQNVMFQSWSVGTDTAVGTGTVSRIDIIGNILIGQSDPSQPLPALAQGIINLYGMSDSWVIENNVVSTAAYNGIALYGAINSLIINNTVVENAASGSQKTKPCILIADHRPVASGSGTVSVPWPVASSGNIIRNNIISAGATMPTSAGVMDHNITTTDYNTFFTNYSQFDFSLLATSPAVNAGSADLAPATDIQGSTRNSPPDVGAYEFGGTPAMAIYSPLLATGTVGSAFKYTILASDNPTSFSATNLPAGLSVNTATGLISGTPTVSGNFSIGITASNADTSGSATLVLNILPKMPAITSALTATGTNGFPFAYAIWATGDPTGYNAKNLPLGLGINTLTGLITGTPAVTGTFASTISAINVRGTGSAILTLKMLPPPPVITSALTATGSAGFPFGYSITATNNPKSFGASGLPGGLMVSSSTGLISGTPTTSGTFTATIMAANGGGTGYAKLVLTIIPKAPVISSGTTGTLKATGNVGVAFSYKIYASNNPTNYGATGLPDGLTVDAATGLISGTPTASGTFSATISASNAGGTGSAPLVITILPPLPVINSALTASGTTGNPFTYTITASNNPTSYNATSLPAGLTVDTTSGIISGTPSGYGTFSCTISATNAKGSGYATLVIRISPPAPVISSALTVSGSAGASFYYKITATNSPTSYSASGLPAGLVVSSSSGVISGIPTASGTFSATISAANSTGTGSATLVIAIPAVSTLPVINSGLTASGSIGGSFYYKISATNNPTSYSATGLPGGLSVSSTSGVISGYPAASGTYNATISASNAGGTGSATLVITILPLQSPVITGTLAATGTSGVSFYYKINATSSPTSFSASGLPAGLTLSSSSGVISGVTTATGTYSAAISASNATGTGSATLVIAILLPPAVPPVINSALTVTGSSGMSFYYKINATNSPISYGATGLPGGLSVSSSTGVISGYPTATGTYNSTISASNAYGTGSANLVIAILPARPAINSVLTATANIGNAFSYKITASNDPTSYNATGLPSGFSVDTTTGIISGNPTATGTFSSTISASNALGTGSATLVIKILPLPPVINSPLTASATKGSAFSYAITASNNPTSFVVSGLPSGLVGGSLTGLISGTPTVTGTYSVTMRAYNAGGSGSATLALTVLPQAPVITSTLTTTGYFGKGLQYTIAATNYPTSYSATGLPAGLSLSATGSVISGTPTVVGTFPVTISAANVGGSGSATLVMTILPPAPVISSTGSTQITGTIGSAFSYTIVASNNPTSYNATNLPDGLNVDPAVGVISGTPAVSGTFVSTISATNAGGTGSTYLGLKILPAP